MIRTIAALAFALSVLACATAAGPSVSPMATVATTSPPVSPGMPTDTPALPSKPPVVSASPDVPLPSNACGGFHLKVVNGEAEGVTVTINGTLTVIVPAAASESIVQFLPPEKPPMPWTVVLTTPAGTEIGTQTFTGPVDQKLTVSDGGLVVEPYEVREDDC